jgi:hypothetical protein
MEASPSAHGDGFSDLLRRFPPSMDLDLLAREHAAIERGREISDGATLLRLALARGPGGLSLRGTAAWASTIGIAEISNPGLKYRLDKSVEFLAAVMNGLLAARAASTALFWPGRSLHLADGTCISKPGSTGTDWRVHGVFDLGAGGFSHLEVTDAKGSESILRGPVEAGEVRIADRYYCRAGTLQEFSQGSDGQGSDGQGADFIVRVRWNALRLSTTDGAVFNLIEHLETLPDDSAAHTCEVRAAVTDGSSLKLRLVILRKPAEASEGIIKKLLAKARRNRQQVDPRTLVAARFMILATSLPALGYPPDEVMSAYRLRWQIELAFKRLKSLLHIDRLPTLSERASRSWLYAHLILALLSDTLSQEVLESFP